MELTYISERLSRDLPLVSTPVWVHRLLLGQKCRKCSPEYHRLRDGQMFSGYLHLVAWRG